jgi:hypothetical protein
MLAAQRTLWTKTCDTESASIGSFRFSLDMSWGDFEMDGEASVQQILLPAT